MKCPTIASLCLLTFAGALASPMWAQTPEVGSGSPTQSVAQAFIDAYYRNGFNRLVSVPPLADVKKFGTIGLVQEFQDASKTTGVRLALIKPNANTSISETSIGVYQLQAAIYAYYNTVGVTNAGYPASDTMNCPALVSPVGTGNTCVYQLFDKPYALFAYASIGQLLSSTLSIRDPFYTRWNALGGISVLGPPVAAEASVTGGVNGGVSTAETFDRGVLFNITSGSLTGRLMSVKGDVYTVYAANGGATGTLGYPIGDEVLLANGHYRQSFEGGSIEYDPAVAGSGILRPPVGSIQLTPSATSLRLNAGESYGVSAALFSVSGAAIADRTVVWTTSNSRVVTIQASGLSATLRAVGGGSATVAATAEGKTSPAITIFVYAPCCQVGEGSPTAAVQQAFQDIVTRNRMVVKLPAASAVVRVPGGYAQELQSENGQTTFLLVVRAKSNSGYVVAGPTLASYLALGGPGGALGLPASDFLTAGLQLFDGGALSGNPPQVVSGAILEKWAASTYSGGVATGPAITSLTFRATSVTSQSFERLEIHALNTGPQAGKAFYVAGLLGIIRTAYNANGGVTGGLGAPISDEVGVNSRRRQDFEGGSIDYAPGDAVAAVTTTPRKPLVSATPSTVLAGSTVRLAIGGFDANTTVRISSPGKPDFSVTTATGAFVWDVYIPSSAASGTVSVTATSGSAVAQASYSIRSVADARFTLSVVRGDAQTGAPGALLTESLRVSLKDQNGNPAIGQAVAFAASPGAVIDPSAMITDVNGEASATLRLPLSEGLTLATASAAHQSVTFSARSSAYRLANYPSQTQTFDQLLGNGSATIRQKGAMLAAFSSMLRYYQDHGDAPSPNGPGDPVALNAFLRALCPVDTQGAPGCDSFYAPEGSTDQSVNPFRVPAFAGNGIDLAIPTFATSAPTTDALLARIRDLVSQGTPVLIPLALSSGPSLLGAHYVVAYGVAANGGIVIFDPNPIFGRTLLGDYLAGFPLNGQTVSATLSPTLLYFVLQPFRFAFTVTSNVPVTGFSLSRSCSTFSTLDTVAAPGGPSAGVPQALVFTACDGVDSAYELDFAKPAAGLSVRAVFRDLANPGYREAIAGSAAISKLAQRANAQWTPSDIAPNFPIEGVINAASGVAGFTPGGILTIYGSGFGSDASSTRTEVGGIAARIVSVNPFQLNIQLPETVRPGVAALRVTTPAGAFERNITITDVAPGIFTFPGQPAITNQNGALNGPSSPALRGEAIVIYSTGLGITSQQGNLRPASTPVKVVRGSQELTPFYAGATPGIPGLYQVNVIIPTASAPGLKIPLYLKQGAMNSNSVPLAVQ